MAKSLIKEILEVDPRKRLSIKQILAHEWLADAPSSLEIFTESEMATIKKEFTYNNVRRLNRNLDHQTNTEKTEDRAFTEHPLDSTSNSLMRNATTKSVILAPFNSTLTHIDPDEGSLDAEMYRKGEVMKFGV